MTNQQALSRETLKQYRSIAHQLKPVVMVSDKGVSEGVKNEIERALNDHELIKIKISIADRDSRKQVITQILTDTHAELVQEIGKMLIIYRLSDKKEIKTSNVR